MKRVFTVRTNTVNVDQFWNTKDDPKAIVAPLIVTFIISAIYWYFRLPAINLKDRSFWSFLMVVMIIYMIAKSLINAQKRRSFTLKRPIIITLVLFIGLLVLNIASSRLFHAKRYADILKVQDDTIEIIPSVSSTSSIALMDTASAERLGDRRIGSLTHVVSQFNVASYVQINYQETPVKVAPLRFDGFFKWMSNKEKGVPGYVVVNPVDMSADYKALDTGMIYVPSAYFSKDLYRHIRMHYPFDLFENLHFEIDENGKPWYVASIYRYSIGMFGGKTIAGAFTIDPVSGEISKYSVEDTPNWVDVVFYGDLICTQYNDHAQLQHGFLNSIFSQTDCRQVTTIQKETEDGDYEAYPDYGYIAKDNDIWIYTGVTSVNGDSSNLGFILANERTSETKFVTVAGADEFSGMKSAEGEVQEKRYTASFPSLINVENTPTYIMVLKDNNGLVKMYAAVNVEQYNIVSTATTQEECIEKYRQLLNGDISSNDDPVHVIDQDTFKEKEITIKKIATIDQNGNTWIYIVDENNNIYTAKYADVLKMLLVNEGDTIKIMTDGTNFALNE